MVVGNGYAQAREVATSAGAVEVQARRVDDRRGGEAFRSQLVPPNMPRSLKVTEVLPILYLGGRSTGDFIPALVEFPGSEAGPSASISQRLTVAWEAEDERSCERDLGARLRLLVGRRRVLQPPPRR